MAIAVNLLNDKNILSEKDYQKERELFKYGLIFFTVSTMIVVSLGLVSFFYSQKLNLVEDDIARSTKELASLAEANAQQIYLKNRLQLITAFLSGRTIQREAMQRIFSLDIPGVVVSSVSFVNETTLGVQLSADNSLAFGEAISYLSAPTSFFTQVVSKGVTSNPNGGYQVLLTLSVPGGSK